MLAGNFFTINTIKTSGNKIKAQIEINPSHPIFHGHFPAHPLVPGVCMMQMIKEIAESVIGQKTRLVKSDHLKFLSVIDPRVNSSIQADLSYTIDEGGEINIVASLLNAEVIFLKFKGILIKGDFPARKSPEKSL